MRWGRKSTPRTPGFAPSPPSAPSSCSISPMWRWVKIPYALTLSLTSPNWRSGLGVAAGARDAALRVHDEVGDEPGAGERREREDRRRRVAAGRADDRARRAPDRGRAPRDAARAGRRRRSRAGRPAGGRSGTSAGSRRGRGGGSRGRGRSRSAHGRGTRRSGRRRRRGGGRGTRPRRSSGTASKTLRSLVARCGWMPAIGSPFRSRPTRPTISTLGWSASSRISSAPT